MTIKYLKTVSFCDDCDYGKDGEFCSKCGEFFIEGFYPEIPKWCPLKKEVNYERS